MSGASSSFPFQSTFEASSSSSTASTSTPQPNPQDILKQLFGNICKEQIKQKLIGEVDNLKAKIQKENPDPQEIIMSIPMLLALTICPAMLGTQEAIRQSQSKTKREEHRARRCNLAVSCVKPSIRSRDINNKLVVLKDNKLFIANEHPLYNHDPKNNISKGYSFSGYFLPYPDTEYEGLVSTISDDPPMLNWIYVDKKTHEVKYGVRADAQENITGPFDCTKQDRRLTLEGWEGFCAVEELPGIWALYYDRDDNGLKGKVPMGTRVLEVELSRREKKEPKPEPNETAPMTLDEKWKQHKAETAEAEKDKEAFLSSGAQSDATPIAPATGSAQSRGRTPVSTAEARKSQYLSDAMRRLSLDNLSNSSHAPSVLTSDFSIWSAARKHVESDADGSESVTAASSVFDRNHESASVSNGSDDGMYKKPYVEDAHADTQGGNNV
ncbi:hypothetical protein BGZ63DRAFT_462541 [Mariannaea sp. PMI_226]|nr:hypothetical protein BGZ63DRAFT_462541 [Mariannaea sp. PMI_226]